MGKPRQAFCQWFLGKSDKESQEFTPQPEEVEQVAWVSIDWLKNDYAKHPDKYVPSMGSILELLYKN